MSRLFVIIFFMTVTELYLLFTVGSRIGILNTILLIFITASIGSWQLKKQGSTTLRNLNNPDKIDKTILDGIALLISSVMLITPGFITDIIGLLLLIPAIRVNILSIIKKQFKTNKMNSSFYFKSYGFSKEHKKDNREEKGNKNNPTIIEGEFFKEDDKD